MKNFLKRVGTTYIPVNNPEEASSWYRQLLGAVENYRDENKAILDLANQSFFLVKARPGEKIGFIDYKGEQHFAFTFEVNGLDVLKQFHTFLRENGVVVSEIEDRGHPGYNFVFYDMDGNCFDVWSELSHDFKEKYQLEG
ncbi:VOC family protein [Ornithinibacillus contaminans]|uniref:VOC family protein n=1 Tax=Ornithinibacillus contaminans TaxID=694055 RepID=UPI00064DC337|nr:VOC family protein [Ornithinibacillus contaminans]